MLKSKREGAGVVGKEEAGEEEAACVALAIQRIKSRGWG